MTLKPAHPKPLNMTGHHAGTAIIMGRLHDVYITSDRYSERLTLVDAYGHLTLRVDTLKAMFADEPGWKYALHLYYNTL